ncbi:hypothetical protein ACFVTC_01740 [Streptomyces sp. NPDC057950]|uniref:hypothetical protein n=1 Tax=Streptomyces sp. NPDC057950 TaxID=3346288 RepID=UPI0036E316A3
MTGEGPAEAREGASVVIDVSASPSGAEFEEAALPTGSDPHIAGTLSDERAAHQG